jgi:NADPH:quinone reductase-like Zn-dependent oxidoreductase/acyl carrier protein
VPGEVAIEVFAVGLNFIDVTKAMGIYPGLDPALSFHFGVECAGRVASIGPDVTAFDIDDEVVAITSDLHANGVFASYVILPISLVARKPRHLSMEEAAAAPIAYLTAYHSLVKLANMQAGEWVLIPSAAGGVGLAAIEIAQQLGAHVIATAGTSEKQEYLKARGVVHVLPSRSLDFAEQALAITGGRGVDIVLNSLTGEFITKSLEILAPYGRFIELGKRDIYDDRRIGLKLFRNNLSYHVVDIGAFLRDRQWALSLLFQHSIRQIDEGTWRALPVQAFPVSEPEKPFHYMATAKHIGKLAIVMDRSVKVLPRKDKQLFCTDASYIITGAFGGVGSAVAEWMAENGAGHLVLVSRRKPSTETREVIRRIGELGAVATHIEADVSNEKDVSDLISTVRTQMPQLRGIMHTAAIIDDALIKDLDSQRYEPVMGAKVEGAWNLHSATLDSALDFFVLFSSAAAIYTQPGMGSYAAANAFLDALAHYRRAQGFAAASVNWGGWDGIGLAREAGTKRSLAGFEEQGLRSFSKDKGLHCLREILERNSVQTVVFRFDPGEFAQFHAQSGIPRLFKNLAQGVKSGSIDASQHPAIRESLISVPSMSSRIEVLEAYLQEQLSSVLRCSPDRIDRDRTLGAMGLDSLMALEFVRRLNTGLGIALPATSVFNYPTIKLLAQQIIVKMRLSTDSEPAVVSAEKAEHRSSTSMADDLSEEEALRELMYPGEAVDER